MDYFTGFDPSRHLTYTISFYNAPGTSDTSSSTQCNLIFNLVWVMKVIWFCQWISKHTKSYYRNSLVHFLYALISTCLLFSGLKVQITHLGNQKRKYRVLKLTPDSASRQTFPLTLEDGSTKKVTVQQYFKDQYKRNLQ